MNKIQIIVKTQVANFLIASVYYLYSKNKGNLVFSFLRKVYYSLLKKFGMSVMPILDCDAYNTNCNSVEVLPIKSKRVGFSGNCVFLDNKTPYISVRRAWRSVNNRPVVSTELKSPAAKRDIPIPQCLVDCLQEAKSNSISVNNSRSFERASNSQNELLKKNSIISQRSLRK